MYGKKISLTEPIKLKMLARTPRCCFCEDSTLRFCDTCQIDGKYEKCSCWKCDECMTDFMDTEQINKLIELLKKRESR